MATTPGTRILITCISHFCINKTKCQRQANFIKKKFTTLEAEDPDVTAQAGSLSTFPVLPHGRLQEQEHANTSANRSVRETGEPASGFQNYPFKRMTSLRINTSFSLGLAQTYPRTPMAFTLNRLLKNTPSPTPALGPRLPNNTQGKATFYLQKISNLT